MKIQLLTVVLALSLAGVASAATNLAPNGNFEQAGTNSPVASWTVEIGRAHV